VLRQNLLPTILLGLVDALEHPIPRIGFINHNILSVPQIGNAGSSGWNKFPNFVSVDAAHPFIKLGLSSAVE